jgi:transposase
MKRIHKEYVGIDVSKNHLDIHIHPVNKKLHVRNSVDGFDKLIQKLSQYSIGQIVCESSGGYQQNVKAALENFGYNVWVVDPNRIKSFIRSEGIRVKTDAHDAKMIALFASEKSCHYVPHKASKELSYLKNLVDRRINLVAMRSNEKKRAKHPSQNLCKKYIKSHITFLENEIQALDKEMDTLIRQSNEFVNRARIIQSAPGVGKTISAMILAHMPELGILDNKSVAALAGVAPYSHESGMYKGRAMISGGRKIARHALYMASLSIISHKKSFLGLFYKTLIDSGKPGKVALVAVMRKLIVILNAMIKNKELWKEK